MKICFIADGVSVHTQRWLNYLAECLDEVHLICWKVNSGYSQKVKIHILRNRFSHFGSAGLYIGFVGMIFQARKLLKLIKPNLVDAHFLTTYGFMGACTGFHPMVATAWGSDVLILPHGNPLFKFTAKFALAKSDAVVCTGLAIKEEIVRLGTAENKIKVVVLGGVNNKVFCPAPKNATLLARYGIPLDEPLVVSTRNFAPVYNLETLIKAFSRVTKYFPDCKLAIAGRGEQANKLKLEVTKLKLSDKIVFTGWISPKELPDLLSSADIYVSTAVSDGTSNSLLEAMACGISPLVTDIPANRQWIKEDENGSLFPVRDDKALAEKLVMLMRNPLKRKSLGSAARQTILDKANPDVEMKKLVEVYRELCNRFPQPR